MPSSYILVYYIWTQSLEINYIFLDRNKILPKLTTMLTTIHYNFKLKRLLKFFVFFVDSNQEIRGKKYKKEFTVTNQLFFR